MLTDTQIEIAVRLNTAMLALHEAIKVTVGVGWPDYTEELREALERVRATYRSITKEET